MRATQTQTKSTKLSAYPSREEMRQALAAGVSAAQIWAAVNRNNEVQTIETEEWN